ncbi:hypothetical protein LguiA_010605 [Lonicera macranthoides]
MEGQGGGEVRRIHIIYYLSRKGRIEHPHLIRVHHLSRNGVHLRDVKRWLSELRGKDIADSFAWSYKRRYKKVFLWQDLVDEDLITPVSDNEYVLKGSEISSTFINDLSSYGEEEEVILRKEPQPIDQIDHKNFPKEETEDHPQTPMDDSTQKPSEIKESSPPYSTQTSTVTEDSIKLEVHEDMDSHKQKRQEQEEEEYENGNGKFGNDSVYSNLLNNHKSKNNGKNSNGSTPDSSTSFGSNSPYMRKSHRRGASSMIRSLISCRAVDTMDSATVKINKESKNSTILHNNRRETCKGGVCEIRREQQNGGRISWSGVKDSKINKKSGFSEQKTFSAAYKPINGPNCSQCGRQFKPEKMHKHMKYCKGMKAFPKSEKTPHNRPMDSPNQDSVSAYYYLTHK